MVLYGWSGHSAGRFRFTIRFSRVVSDILRTFVLAGLIDNKRNLTQLRFGVFGILGTFTARKWIRSTLQYQTPDEIHFKTFGRQIMGWHLLSRCRLLFIHTPDSVLRFFQKNQARYPAVWERSKVRNMLISSVRGELPDKFRWRDKSQEQNVLNENKKKQIGLILLFFVPK